jgi:hypothetical protein
MLQRLLGCAFAAIVPAFDAKRVLDMADSSTCLHQPE